MKVNVEIFRGTGTFMVVNINGDGDPVYAELGVFSYRDVPREFDNYVTGAIIAKNDDDLCEAECLLADTLAEAIHNGFRFGRVVYRWIDGVLESHGSVMEDISFKTFLKYCDDYRGNFF